MFTLKTRLQFHFGKTTYTFLLKDMEQVCLDKLSQLSIKSKVSKICFQIRSLVYFAITKCQTKHFFFV